MGMFCGNFVFDITFALFERKIKIKTTTKSKILEDGGEKINQISTVY